MENMIIAASRLTSGQFVRFARFNTYRRGKKLIGPFIFMVIMMTFAIICSLSEDGMLLTVVLAGLGIGLPLVYVLQFEWSLVKQCRVMKLDGLKTVYTLRFSTYGVNVKAKDGSRDYRWNELTEAYRNKDCIYLYTEKGNAYLIPDDELYSSDEIWKMISEQVTKTVVIK